MNIDLKEKDKKLNSRHDLEAKRYSARRVLELMNLNDPGMTAEELRMALQAEADDAQAAFDEEWGSA